MSRVLPLVLALGCHEYTVELSQVGVTPLPVALGATVELPVGLVVTVLPSGHRNGEPLDADVSISLASSDASVLSVAPVAEAVGQWGLVGASVGQVWLEPEVDGHNAVPIEVIVTAQPKVER